MNPEQLATGAIWYVAFLLSLTCHEAAHALVALWGGDDTAAAGGQVTLNPVPHMQRSPFGTIAVPLISFALNGWMLGWASAPYNPLWEQRYPHRSGWMALAGPAANFLLMMSAAIAINVGIWSGFFEIPDSITYMHLVQGEGDMEPVALFVSVLFTLNILLMTFNLLPVPPLDGNTVVGLFVSEQRARDWFDFSRDPNYGFMGLIIAWVLFGRLFWPILRFAVDWLYWV